MLVHGWGTDGRRNGVDTGWVDGLAAERREALARSALEMWPDGHPLELPTIAGTDHVTTMFHPDSRAATVAFLSR